MRLNQYHEEWIPAQLIVRSRLRPCIFGQILLLGLDVCLKPFQLPGGLGLQLTTHQS